MKPLSNVNPRTVKEAVSTLIQVRQSGRQAAVTGGGTDLVGMMKDRLVQPDVVVNLKTIGGMSDITANAAGVRIGALVTLAALGRDPAIAARYPMLSEAANSVGTPQIRNAATVAGNICQRPWCWYLRNSFPCYKNGGDRCFAPTGENQLHAIFGGGPSYIVHPSDIAPALVALDARITIAGPAGERTVPSREFFALPKVDPARENVLADDDVVVDVTIPPGAASARSTYRKLLDREAWTHAVVSAAVVLEMDGETCRNARIVLGGVAPIPWDRPDAAAALRGRRLTPDLIDRAAQTAVEDARPMTRNGYKVPLTRALVRRTLLELSRQDPQHLPHPGPRPRDSARRLIDRVMRAGSLDRRNFLRRAAGRHRSATLCCDRLYVRYVDAVAEGRVSEFVEAVEKEIGTAHEIHVTRREWLERDDFKRVVERIVSGVSSSRKRRG